MNLPQYIIHGVAAAVGLLMCHGLFTEVLMNPLAVKSRKPRLIYKQLHSHMNQFMMSQTITGTKQQLERGSFINQLIFLSITTPGNTKSLHTCQIKLRLML